MDKKEFIKELEKLSIILTSDQLEKLDKYYQLLIDYNKHTNLTRITDEKEVYLKHFYDSLTLIKAVNLNSQSLMDIGTGAGFPGMVLKIVFPNLKVTLLDSLNKRIMFLKEVIKKLDLKNIDCIHARAEEYVGQKREKYDIVTSRAVANLRVLSELCVPYVKVGGTFIPMKADSDKEINESLLTIKKLGCQIDNIISFDLPKSSGKRTLIKISKSVKTDSKYPRKFSEIKKKPL